MKAREYNPETDLFTNGATLPDEVQSVLNKYSEIWDENYTMCEAMLKELNEIGYTFDYYLTAEPYNLHKL
jgi:hypothetical protein